MLTYMQIHLYFTLPPTIILYLLMRPLISRFDKLKLMTLCILAVFYTTPWDNYIIYHKAWWYRNDAIIGTIGYVPIEEYLFFIIQTMFTSLWTISCSRWTLNSLYLRSTKSLKFQWWTKYMGIAVMVIAILWGWFNAVPDTKVFYLCSILWWTLLVVVLLWYVGSSYIVQSYQQILLSVVFPSLYLCYVDLTALRAKVWHINERTSLEIFIVPELPIEEAIFFFISNFIVVLGAAGFDKSKAVIDTYFKEPLKLNWSRGYFYNIKLLATAAICQEHELDSTVVDDLEVCVDILDEGSKTFSVAANCFPNGKYIFSSDLIVYREPTIFIWNFIL